MGNLDPAIKKLEQEIAGLRVRCDLLGITIGTGRKIMWAKRDWVVIHLRVFPEHGYDPWVFEKEFLEKTLEMYFEQKPKRLI